MMGLNQTKFNSIHRQLTIASGENTPNCTFLILRNRHFECVKFRFGFDDMAMQQPSHNWFNDENVCVTAFTLLRMNALQVTNHTRLVDHATLLLYSLSYLCESEGSNRIEVVSMKLEVRNQRHLILIFWESENYPPSLPLIPARLVQIRDFRFLVLYHFLWDTEYFRKTKYHGISSWFLISFCPPCA